MSDVLPLPEIISGERFEVRRSRDANTAYIDLKGRQLVVPFDNDPHAVFVRAHETGHLRWTPLTGKSKVRADVEDRTFQAIEDLRINAGLRASGIRTDAAPTVPSGFDSVAPGTPEIEVARCVAGLHGRAEAAAYRAAALAAGYDRAVAAGDEIVAAFTPFESAGKVAPFALTLRSAERLTEILSAAPAPEEDPEDEDGDGQDGDGDSDEDGQDDGQDDGDSAAGDSAGDGEEDEDEEDGDGQGDGQEDEDEDGQDGPGAGDGDSDEDEEEDEDGDGQDGDGDSDEEDEDGQDGDGDSDEDEDGQDGDSDEDGDDLPGDTPADDGDGQGHGPGDDPAAADPGERKIDNGSLTSSWSPGSDGNDPGPLPDLTEEEAREILRANFNPAAGTADPGPLREITPPLTQTIKPPKIATARRTTDSGSIPVAMHRFACDSRVFRSSKPGRDGVAILIDGSASLNLTGEMISEILDECPAAVIAVYSGHVAQRKYGERRNSPALKARGYGELIILANGKRRVADISPYKWTARGTGNNVVDRPALEWLAARKERRKLWLCDGLVTGLGNEILSPTHTRAMAATIHAAKIVRVGSFSDLMENREELFNVHRHVTYRAKDGRFAGNMPRVFS